MAWILVLLAAAVVVPTGAVRRRESGDRTSPVLTHIVEPGEWLTDKAGKFMFLPLVVPENVGHERCKIMANGDSLIVVVTERAEEKPETAALRKFKLVVQAFKDEGILNHDESGLKTKLEEWLEDEDDDEVRQYIMEALTSLKQVQAAKQNTVPRQVSLRLSLLSERSKPRSILSQKGSGSTALRHRSRAGIVKESFSIDIPYPVPADQVFVLSSSPTTLLVGMPLLRSSLEASGVSTGGKPFARVPVYGSKGEHLVEATEAGKAEDLAKRARLIVPAASLTALRPLSTL